MRVLHMLSAPAAGGAEVYVKDLSKALVNEGLSVTIAFLCRAIEIGRSEEFENEFLAELDSAGVAWFFVGKKYRKKPWLGVNIIRKFVMLNKIDICHSHLPFGVVFSFGLPVPRVYTHHTIKPRLNWITYRLFNSVIDRYVGISKVCAAALEGYSGKKVTTILNAVDSSKFSVLRRNMPGIEGELKALVVGRIHPHKGYYFLGKVVEMLPKYVRSNIKIRIVGEGEPEYVENFKRFLKSKGIDQTFEILGNRSDVPQLMIESDLFLMSSMQEGLPISLIEATISGLPCIVTDVGGCAEIISKCKNGLTVPYGDVECYARVLTEVLNNPLVLKTWADNSRRHSWAFDIGVSAQRHIELYRELLQYKTC